MRGNIRTIFGNDKVILRDTPRPVTPFGGLFVWTSFLKKVGWHEAVRGSIPFSFNSPNAIEPSETFTAFVFSVVAGARRFAHTSILRADKALHAMVGWKRFPCDDTIRNFFRRFGMGEVQRFFPPLWEWLLSRLPSRPDGYTLDLDSTIFVRYGKQEGVKKGYNPQKHGRASHHPLLAVLAETQTILHGWLRSGNVGSAQGAVNFLTEALTLLPAQVRLRGIRADSGFLDDKFLTFLEERDLPYVVVARLTSRLKRELVAVKTWTPIDFNYAVGEIHLTLFGWAAPRRFVVVRERVRDDKPSLGRKLLEVPGYTFRCFVTNRKEDPLDIWREYNPRAVIEDHIKELKYDLAADDFCLRQFYATEAAFRTVLLVFNLLSEFQRAAGLPKYNQPASLRTKIFLCGAILGRSGHHRVLHLSLSWGGLLKRNALISNILNNSPPTSPKLDKPLLATS